MSKKAWISAGKVSAAIAALALLLGAVFQGQAQQRSDMADVRAELRSGFAQVNERFAQVDARFAQVDARFAQMAGRFSDVNGRFDSIDRDLSNLRERVARIEGHLALPADAASQANSVP